MNRIDTNGSGHLRLREKSNKTKGHEEDRQNSLRPSMSERGEQENQRA